MRWHTIPTDRTDREFLALYVSPSCRPLTSCYSKLVNTHVMFCSALAVSLLSVICIFAGVGATDHYEQDQHAGHGGEGVSPGSRRHDFNGQVKGVCGRSLPEAGATHRIRERTMV